MVISSSSSSGATAAVLLMFAFNVSKETVSVRQCGEGMGDAVVMVTEVADADDDMVALKGRGQLEDVL